MKWFLQRFTAVYTGLEWLAAFNGGFQNDKIHNVAKIFNINPWWPNLQVMPLANSMRQKK